MSTEIYGTRRRDFLKEVAIGAGGLALGYMLIHPEEAMGQSIEDYLGKIPMEARWKAACNASVNATVNSWKFKYENKGQEKYVEDSKMISLQGGAVMKGYAIGLGCTGNDPKSVATIWPALAIVTTGPEQKYEIVDVTEEKARLKCINCVFWNTIQQKKITYDLCSTGSRYLAEGIAKAMNPKMTSTFVKARPRGDSVCEWVFELKA